MFRLSTASVHGPGEFTLTAVVLFTLSAYGLAAGSVTGDQTVVAVGVFCFTLFLTGVIWPIVKLSRLTIEVIAPSDATVGDEVPLFIRIHGRADRVEVRVLDPPGRWWRTPVPGSGTLPHLATRRGVFTYVRVQVRTAAPLGVFVRVRQARVRMDEPITIAPRPRPLAAHLRPVRADLAQADQQSAAAAGGDVVRAVRPYVAGDPARLVHWPTSARAGELVVREHDPPAMLGVALVVDLSGPDEWADEAAARAAGIGRSTLASGGAVVPRPGRPRVRCALRSPTRATWAAGSRAVGGPPAEPPDGWPVRVVRAIDTDLDALSPPVVPSPIGSGRR